MSSPTRKDDDVLKAIGRRMQKFRVTKTKLSTKSLASELQVSQTGLAGNERGENWPGGQLLHAYGQRGVSIDWLLLGLGDMMRAEAPVEAPAIVAQPDPFAITTDAFLLIEDEIDKADANISAQQRARLAVIATLLLSANVPPDNVRRVLSQCLALCL